MLYMVMFVQEQRSNFRIVMAVGRAEGGNMGQILQHLGGFASF